mmetsp:Transcript_56701/g.124310  ORF Transcript_56701/g.124310 Transcript_56701/m.124310 type:complete len:96 (+) Transcript_56701:456-743(+)
MMKTWDLTMIIGCNQACHCGTPDIAQMRFMTLKLMQSSTMTMLRAAAGSSPVFACQWRAPSRVYKAVPSLQMWKTQLRWTGSRYDSACARIMVLL